jgi:hypothetical protein
MPRLTKHEWGSLWTILWRVLLVAPVLWVLGFALLVLVLAGLVAPPFYAASAFISGHWLLGIVALTAWIVILRFRRPLLGWVMQGSEHMSL